MDPKGSRFAENAEVVSRGLRRVRVLLLVLLALFPLAAAAPLPEVPAPYPVVAAGYSFAPSVLVIPLGATVEWTSAQLQHTVTTADSLTEALDGWPNDASNSDGNADTWSAGLRVGETFRHTFENVGSFAYFCEPHHEHGMVGLVVVV